MVEEASTVMARNQPLPLLKVGNSDHSSCLAGHATRQVTRLHFCADGNFPIRTTDHVGYGGPKTTNVISL
jgi:hypothetical protein